MSVDATKREHHGRVLQQRADPARAVVDPLDGLHVAAGKPANPAVADVIADWKKTVARYESEFAKQHSVCFFQRATKAFASSPRRRSNGSNILT